MKVTNLASLDSVLKKHASARAPMARWIAIVGQQNWENILEARAMLPSADAIKSTAYTCFNIGGNSFRLITIVSYRLRRVQIVELLTHAEYSRKYV